MSTRLHLVRRPRWAPILSALCLLAGQTASADTTLMRRPDSIARGELATGRPEAMVRQDMVALDAGKVVADGRGAPELRLDLFPDVSLQAILGRFEQAGKASHWLGYVADDPASMVVLTVADGRMVGTVVHDGRRYLIAWLPSGNYSVAEIDLAAFSYEDAPRSPRDDGSTGGSSLGSNGGSTRRRSTHSTVDVMVAWSSDANGIVACELFSRVFLAGLLNCLTYQPAHQTNWKPIIETVLIPHAIAESNFVFVNSGLGSFLRLVHTQEVAYAGSADLQQDLALLTGTSDGVLDEVHSYRDKYAADVVMLMTYESDYALCGVANLPGTIDVSWAKQAFGVVSGECFLASDFTFVHELGHIMGAQHDWYAFADLQTGGTDVPPKKYAHGYTVMPAGLMTIMAYPDECLDKGGMLCARLPFFSDGGVWGQPLNAARPANNTKMLTEILSTVASYR